MLGLMSYNNQSYREYLLILQSSLLYCGLCKTYEKVGLLKISLTVC